MGYYSDDETNRQLSRLEKKISKEYSKAYREMKATANEYFSTLQARYDKEYEAYLQGAYTDAEFKLWYKTQVQRGKGYNRMADELAMGISNANQIASAYINDKTPSIYSLNRNYEAYMIDKVASINFHAYDKQTIKNLITGQRNTVEFRTVKVNPVRDYEWNREQIESAITSGILQGKPIDKIADSYLSVMKRNRASAVRNARTAVTSAQNAGRLSSMEWADEQGIKVEKQWMATLDSRTRDSHMALDGETVPIRDTFSNGLEYPSDPAGDPSEVYNCRCTMITVYPDYKNTNLNRRARDNSGQNQIVTNMTYEGRDESDSYKEWLRNQ